MANSYKCDDCGGDATRCNCHRNRVMSGNYIRSSLIYRDPEKLRLNRIAELEKENKELLKKIKK